MGHQSHAKRLSRHCAADPPQPGASAAIRRESGRPRLFAMQDGQRAVPGRQSFLLAHRDSRGFQRGPKGTLGTLMSSELHEEC